MTEDLLEVIKSAKKREDIARVYQDLLYEDRNKIDWHIVNQAIITRWSKSGLMWIKSRAWALANA